MQMVHGHPTRFLARFRNLKRGVSFAVPLCAYVCGAPRRVGGAARARICMRTVFFACVLFVINGSIVVHCFCQLVYAFVSSVSMTG
jgi:hypothetical protein